MKLCKDYLYRYADADISRLFGSFDVVCIEGVKGCGKTYTALRHSERVVSLDVPPARDAVRLAVAPEAKPGAFLLTHSCRPKGNVILPGETGCLCTYRMEPMSLYESQDSSGTVSLQELFHGWNDVCATGNVSLEHLVDLTVRGGWPASLTLDEKTWGEIPRKLLHSVVVHPDGVPRSSTKLKALLLALARNESKFASNQKLVTDIATVSSVEVSRNTVRTYLDELSRLFLLEDQNAYVPPLRSSTKIGKRPKRHFVDPSLAIAALGLSSTALLGNLYEFGFMFEALCVRDLRIYAHALGGALYQYHDERGREISAIVDVDGLWGAFSLVLGAHQIDAAAVKLIATCRIFVHQPTFLCVICGLSIAAYRRKDGVYVLPITALRA